VPGARIYAVTWTDASGNLWLFGGSGYDSNGTAGSLNDLWKFNGGNWTWVSGSESVSQAGIYGAKGTTAPTNMPGARNASSSCVDASGNLWLFGGSGKDSTGTYEGTLNDLWKFDGSHWTWVSGSNATGQAGKYGTKGVPSPGNMPGARLGAVTWFDLTGNLWLFGGSGNDSSTAGDLSDLWKFDGSNWTWVSGSNTVNHAGIYGAKGIPDADNMPGARNSAVSWVDGSGNLWLFGGYGKDNTGAYGGFNDLWKFNGSNWTWMSGASTLYETGVYGTKGTPSATNMPGAHASAATWIDGSGNLWFFGGSGRDNFTGETGSLNDLWKFDGINWIWVGGSNTLDQTGLYGTIGTQAANNMPGARSGAVSWIDKSGNLWLFGGQGYDFAGKGSYLNDLWLYKL
jgi:N-acetylneuraminic acid mutarotase